MSWSGEAVRVDGAAESTERRGWFTGGGGGGGGAKREGYEIVGGEED